MNAIYCTRCPFVLANIRELLDHYALSHPSVKARIRDVPHIRPGSRLVDRIPRLVRLGANDA